MQTIAQSPGSTPLYSLHGRHPKDKNQQFAGKSGIPVILGHNKHPVWLFIFLLPKGQRLSGTNPSFEIQ